MNESFAAPSCKIQIYLNGAEALAVLSGSLRMNESERVKQMLLAAMSPRVQTMNLYLSQLREIDSAGLGVIVGLHMTSRKNKQELLILGPNPQQMHLFEATRLTKLLTIIPMGPDAEHRRMMLEKPEFAEDGGSGAGL